ncbi:hypothetical protein SNEBB_005866, partial [Seison nebaliae]
KKKTNNMTIVQESSHPLYKRNGKAVYGVLPPISRSPTIPTISLRRRNRTSADTNSNESIPNSNDRGIPATMGPTVNNSYRKYQGILQFGHREPPNAPHTTYFPMPGSWRTNRI